jgi:hypothetical protein
MPIELVNNGIKKIKESEDNWRVSYQMVSCTAYSWMSGETMKSIGEAEVDFHTAWKDRAEGLQAVGPVTVPVGSEA